MNRGERERNETQERQVMPKIIICHLLASAQCNWSLLANFFPVSILGMMACGMEYPPGQSGSLVLAILPRWQSLGNCKVLKFR